MKLFFGILAGVSGIAVVASTWAAAGTPPEQSTPATPISMAVFLVSLVVALAVPRHKGDSAE